MACSRNCVAYLLRCFQVGLLLSEKRLRCRAERFAQLFETLIVSGGQFVKPFFPSLLCLRARRRYESALSISTLYEFPEGVIQASGCCVAE